MSKGFLWLGLLAGVSAVTGCQKSNPLSPEPKPIEAVDSGTQPVGTDGGVVITDPPDAGPGAGPWPTTPLLNYTKQYDLGQFQAMGVDDAYNIWLLQQDKIGVLRPGDDKPTWTSRIGQAAPGFGPLAMYSTVICGGKAGRAYVGYAASDALSALRNGVDDPEYKKGDMDAVKLNADGTVSLEEHLTQTVRYAGKVQSLLGIRNSNAWIYDEDRTVLVCTKVMRGPNKGDMFIGTNHGITMVRDLVYNSHRHAVWYAQTPNGPSLRLGYNYTVGIGQDGNVLIANEYKAAIIPAPQELITWDDEIALPFKMDTFVPVNSPEEQDGWRGFTQAKSGEWYLSSNKYGLWTFATHEVGSAAFKPVSGLPTTALGMSQATDDGSVFVATEGYGLWEIKPDRTLAQVRNIEGNIVKQLLYDPTVTPSMLYVLTNAGLTVLRGH